MEENGVTREILAEFDPTYKEGEHSDASKISGGNRQGTASDQRVTLDLADDYYKIASESTYNYSKDETGKTSKPHEGVKQWHYFVNEIYFAEYGENSYKPYTVTINVKEKENGQFVYSFSAEKNSESATHQTLHADVGSAKSTTNGKLTNNSISQKSEKSTEIQKKNLADAKATDRVYLDAVKRGDTETAERMVREAAKNAMPDTKIVDEDGYPLIVYHGTSERFNEFDMSKGRSTMDIQGAFFSPWELDAKGYGDRVGAYFLDLYNPAEESVAYPLQIRPENRLRYLLYPPGMVYFEEKIRF